jgi:hypothetical protein
VANDRRVVRKIIAGSKEGLNKGEKQAPGALKNKKRYTHIACCLEGV